jgi:hypothetical protein
MRLLHGRWRRRVLAAAAGTADAAQRARVEAHLEGCAACRAEHEALGRVVGLFSRDPVRDADAPVPFAALRTRVLARLDALEPEDGAARRRPVLGWAAAAAAAAAVAATVLWPRTTHAPAPGGPPSPPAVAGRGEAQEEEEFVRHMERVVAREQAARYLGEAGDVLVTVAARPRRCRKGHDHVDVGEEAQRSRELLARRSLLDVDEAAVASARPVLDDVEQVLREVASLESCARRHDLRAINRQVERSRLLLKIDLMTRELQG